jgi:hypothetical protein
MNSLNPYISDGSLLAFYLEIWQALSLDRIKEIEETIKCSGFDFIGSSCGQAIIKEMSRQEIYRDVCLFLMRFVQSSMVYPSHLNHL